MLLFSHLHLFLIRTSQLAESDDWTAPSPLNDNNSRDFFGFETLSISFSHWGDFNFFQTSILELKNSYNCGKSFARKLLSAGAFFSGLELWWCGVLKIFLEILRRVWLWSSSDSTKSQIWSSKFLVRIVDVVITSQISGETKEELRSARPVSARWRARVHHDFSCLCLNREDKEKSLDYLNNK